MIQKTKIEWCDYTANPIRYRRADDPTGQRGPVWACVKASEGCQHCYAETLAKRFQGREFTASAMRGVVPYVDEGELRSMLSPRRLPPGSRCFVGDMTDVFGEWVPFELLDRVFAVMALTPQHTYQVLTKRPDRMRAYVSNPVTPVRVDLITACMAEGARLPSNQEHADFQNHVANDPAYRPTWPLPNVWLGTSVEDQRRAAVRIPELLATPAAVRFVSAEPLLGALDLECYLHDSDCWLARTGWEDGAEPAQQWWCICNDPREDRISWVIVGGESGPGARPCDVAWIRAIVSQCRAAGVAVFVKQLGAKVIGPDTPSSLSRWILADGSEWTPPVIGPRAHARPDNAIGWRTGSKGADPAEWPEDLKVREMPEVGA